MQSNTSVCGPEKLKCEDGCVHADIFFPIRDCPKVSRLKHELQVKQRARNQRQAFQMRRAVVRASEKASGVSSRVSRSG